VDALGSHLPAAGASVLVVDDDPFIARLLEIELSAAGFRVRIAGNGVHALELVHEGVPDLVLADVMMPVMDGFELTRRLRSDERTSSVRVVLLTALGLSTGRDEGLHVGADEYVVKPFDVPQLIERIRQLLGEPRTAIQPA
jgi:DNA-binding response OmpR family regulator